MPRNLHPQSFSRERHCLKKNVRLVSSRLTQGAGWIRRGWVNGWYEFTSKEQMAFPTNLDPYWSAALALGALMTEGQHMFTKTGRQLWVSSANICQSIMDVWAKLLFSDAVRTFTKAGIISEELTNSAYEQQQDWLGPRGEGTRPAWCLNCPTIKVRPWRWRIRWICGRGMQWKSSVLVFILCVTTEHCWVIQARSLHGLFLKTFGWINEES